ncbi:hypothetical protein PJL18_01178 [Paenarthrobacter nicotinovorans]|nr:hypothetical protein [Paenarthrobacter nicotinovorans]
MGRQVPVRDGREVVFARTDPFHHFRVVQLVKGRRGQLLPRPGSRHRWLGSATQGVRHDRCLVPAVLAPVHQDLALAQGLLHIADHEVRVIGFQGARELMGERGHLLGFQRAVEPCIEMDAFASAGDGHRFHAHVLQDGTGQGGHFHALGQSGAGTGVQIQDEAVRPEGLARSIHLPLRNVDFQGRDLGHPRERGQVVHHRIDVGVVRMLDGGPGDPAWR